MNDFFFHNPVRVHFGRDALDQLGGELAGFGPRVLLVYGGGSIRRSGLYDRILAMLQGAGKTVFELSGVMPNPRTEKVYEGVELCKTHGVDFILAVGGGSVIDCSKAVALGAMTERDFWQAFYKNGEEAKAALPLGVVLTIPATGSELDYSAVISRWDTSEKLCYDCRLVYPQFALLDPTLTYSLPKRQMVNGIVDTMSHLMELYFSTPDDENLTDAMNEAVMRCLVASARVAVREPEDYDARANILWCSSLALCGLFNNGKTTDWGSHCIEHAISAVYDVAHGAGLAVVHPAYLQYIRASAPERFARFAKNVWGVTAEGRSEEELGLEGLRCLRTFFDELGAPARLSELGVPASAVERLTELSELGCYSYREITRDDVRAILHSVE